MSDKTRALLQAVRENNNNLPRGVILRGEYDDAIIQHIVGSVTFTGNHALESMETEQAREAQTLHSLFIVKPRQTGYAATAAMTAAAIRDPSHTSVYVMHSDETTPDETVDLDKLTDVLTEEGVEVFDNLSLVVQRLNQESLESDGYVLYRG